MKSRVRHVDDKDIQKRSNLAKLTMNLFAFWSLSTTQQLTLLGMSPSSRVLLTKYRNGEPLPMSRDVRDRVGWLLSVHKALALLYPKNEELRAGWVKMKNEVFGGKTPLEVMIAEGLIGIARVSRYLDCQRGL